MVWGGSAVPVIAPLVVVAAIAVRVLLPTSRDPEQPPIDWAGAVLSVFGMGGLVYGIIEAPQAGWLSGRSLLTFGGAALALGLFAWRELSAAHPMLDLSLFAHRRFRVPPGGLNLVFFSMFGTFFLSPPKC